MKYRVHHTTTYAYGESVDLAAHMLHLLPRALPQQTVASAELDTTPAAARTTEGTDHFGNRVTWLFLDLPHAAFEVRLSASVEVGFPAPPDPAATPAVGDHRRRRPRRRARGLAGRRVRLRQPDGAGRPGGRAPMPRPRFRPAGRCWPGCWT